MPLRHLIVLIANAHPRHPEGRISRLLQPQRCQTCRQILSESSMSLAQKDQLLEIGSDGLRLGKPHHMREIERLLRHNHDPAGACRVRTGKVYLFTMSNRTSSLHDLQNSTDQTADATTSIPLRIPCIAARPISNKRMVEPDGIEPTTSCLQSRRSPS